MEQEEGGRMGAEEVWVGRVKVVDVLEKEGGMDYVIEGVKGQRRVCEMEEAERCYPEEVADFFLALSVRQQ